jgi:3'(2'), 5'-bisphosphate nucleotidase
MDELNSNNSNVSFSQKGSAMKFFDLALGVADIYPRFAPTMEWDIAAGHAILRELGGEVFDMYLKIPLVYNKEDLLNPHFIAKTKPML